MSHISGFSLVCSLTSVVCSLSSDVLCNCRLELVYCVKVSNLHCSQECTTVACLARPPGAGGPRGPRTRRTKWSASWVKESPPSPLLNPASRPLSAPSPRPRGAPHQAAELSLLPSYILRNRADLSPKLYIASFNNIVKKYF